MMRLKRSRPYTYAAISRSAFVVLICLLHLLATRQQRWPFTTAYLPNNFFCRTLSAKQLVCAVHREGKEVGDETAKSLKAKAAKLREEAEKLEQDARKRRISSSATSSNFPDTAKSAPQVAQYTRISDSIWQLSYRFSDRPEPRPEEEKEKSMLQPRKFFSGKLTVRFRPDGYTDIITQENLGSSTDAATVTKVWGWDLEKSNEDEKKDATSKVEKEFLLFSADFQIPSVNEDGTRTFTSQRFYFQARQEKEKRTTSISLSEGTVTVKQDIVQKSVRWGFFSPAGILAQFRYVGDFVAKPIRMPDQDET